MTIYEKIVHLRKQKGISQTQLAKALNIKVSRLSMWENGKRTISYEYILKIAEYFEVSITYLTDDDFSTYADYKETLQEVITLASKLDEEQVEELKSFIDYLILKRK